MTIRKATLLLIPLLLGGFLCPFTSHAEEAKTDISPEQLRYFETHVRPNLIKYCYECHSEEGKSRGGLLLDTREAMREGGSSGPLLEGDYPLFVDAITWADKDYEMPPKKKMPDEVIEVLVKWVEMGAPDPRDRKGLENVTTKIDIEAGKKHWAYQPPKKQSGATIDSLVAKKQKELGVTPVGPANDLELLRRLRYDLTGLPPTLPEIKAFSAAAKKDRDAAIQKLVRILLNSPQYGERWGRHWLDVARYAESAGTVNDTYPYAWRYRDYVIDSFNNDTPYDRFIAEQLAGDQLPAKTDEDWQRNLIATGFLAIGPKKQNEKNPRQFHANLLDEQIDTTTRAFLGLTVACARCHDHKFDAIPTTDYYAMAGIFNSSKTYFGTVAGNQNHRATTLISLPIPDDDQAGVDHAALFKQKEAELEAARARNREMRGAGGGRDTFTQRQLVAQRQRILTLEGQLQLMDPKGPVTYGMGVLDGPIEDSNVLVGGEITKKAQKVERGFLQILDFAGPTKIPTNKSGRRELAEWIGSRDNPLTARVMVNRIWSHLFGTPLVETMDNWGVNGLPPTNPELLDYLAVRFMENGWSVKSLIRDIVFSDTYQLDSNYHPANYGKDPANEGYWRANPRQLDAEAIRDSMLCASGQIDYARPKGSRVSELGDTKIGRRTSAGILKNYEPLNRSVYLPMARNALPESLALFDAADPDRSVGARDKTNVAPQSLHLMNSPIVQVRARAMAKRLPTLANSIQNQIRAAFLLCYTRPPDKQELQASLNFLRSFKVEPPEAKAPVAGPAGPLRRDPRMANASDTERAQRRARNLAAQGDAAAVRPPEGQDPLSAFCQALLMSAEFRILN